LQLIDCGLVVVFRIVILVECGVHKISRDANNRHPFGGDSFASEGFKAYFESVVFNVIREPSIFDSLDGVEVAEYLGAI
jgi:hypothetical protein